MAMKQPGPTSRKPSFSPFALPAGFQIFEFDIQGVLGHGGFGITYRAHDRLLDEVVAIKEYLPTQLASRRTVVVQPKSSDLHDDYRAGLESFLKEARMIARVKDRHVVQIRRYFEHNGTGYIVFDYEDGPTLEEKLAAGAIPEEELKAIFLGILDALDAIHGRAILHRDLKPSNVILRNGADPVLIDFGAARDFLARHSRSVTAIVTDGYSPPEQYGSSGEQGPWTDLYALGAIAYRCVTGLPPPNALVRLRNDPLIPASRVSPPEYSRDFLEVIDYMLRIEEVERPSSVEEVRDALGFSSKAETTSFASIEAGGREEANTGAVTADTSGDADIVSGARPVWLAEGKTAGFEFAADVPADEIEVSFLRVSTGLYLSCSEAGQVGWERDECFFFLPRQGDVKQRTFVIPEELVDEVPPGEEVRIASSDRYIDAVTSWPSGQSGRASSGPSWNGKAAFVAIGLLALVGLSVFFYWYLRS